MLLAPREDTGMANTTKPTEIPIPRPPAPIPDAAERLRQMAEEQGVTHTANVEHLEGCLEDLWESDEEFEQFMEILRESRRRG